MDGDCASVFLLECRHGLAILWCFRFCCFCILSLPWVQKRLGVVKGAKLVELMNGFREAQFLEGVWGSIIELTQFVP